MGRLDRWSVPPWAELVTAAEIIRGIENLPADEQASVIRFACRLDAQRKLTGKEPSALATRMVEVE